MNKKIFAIAIAGMAALSSCKKEDAPATPAPDPKPTATTPTPSYSTGDGALVALVTRTTTSTPMGPVSMDLGTGVAVFGNLGAGTYNDAGTITLNDKTLQKQNNNSYVYIPGTTDITGIDFSAGIKWNVGTPAISYNAALGRNMPIGGEISGSYTTVDATADLKVSVSRAFTRADSVYFQLAGPDGYVLKRMDGYATSVTFTAAEVKSCGKSLGCSIVVAAWNHELKTFSGKDVHVINELALSRVVEIK